MAGDTESGVTQTKKVINPRVEIDTSPPFESVKEAVDHFGGGGPWIPHHLLPLAAQQNGSEIFNMDKVEKQAAQLEKDLMIKEQETLNVLKEVEAAKRFVEGIKLSFIHEMSALMASPDVKQRCGGCHSVSPGSISMELDHAKLSLNKTATNLAAIRASVESLNSKMRDGADKGGAKNSDFGKLMPAKEDFRPYEEDRSFQIMKNFPESSILNFEADQFKKMTEASRYEVMKAMSEIERTKTSIKMAEMRLTAARKMEEAAKAVEAIALLEMDNSENSPHQQHMFFSNSGGNGITLSIEEYNSLTHRAHQAEELCKTKFIDQFDTKTNQAEVSIVKNIEETTNRRAKKSLEEALVHEDEYDRRRFDENNVRSSSGRFRFRNSGHRRAEAMNGDESSESKEKVYRSTISIGDILSRKLIVEGNAEREEVSLSQMLREQSGLIMHHPEKPSKEASLDKQFYTQRKKFGFIHVTFPRHSKKKSQFL